MAKCREVKELKSLDAIGISKPVSALVRGCSIDSIVRVARAGNLDSALSKVIGDEYARRCYLDIQNALNKAGYLRTDFYEYQGSFNLLTFIRAMINGGSNDRGFFDETSSIYREVRCFTNEEYENFEGFSDEQLDKIDASFGKILGEDYYIVRCLYGLRYGISRSEEDIAKTLERDVSYVKSIRDEAFPKLNDALQKHGGVNTLLNQARDVLGAEFADMLQRHFIEFADIKKYPRLY